MKNHLKKLIKLLEQATELYHLLRAVIEKEKDAVVGLNLKQLNEACKSKDNLLLKLRILEEQREQIMDKLAAELSRPPQDLTLTKLSQIVDESYARQLRERSTDLLALIETLQAASQHNKFLMSHSLELVRGSYNLLNNLMKANLVYVRSGNLQNNAQSGRLITHDI